MVENSFSEMLFFIIGRLCSAVFVNKRSVVYLAVSFYYTVTSDKSKRDQSTMVPASFFKVAKISFLFTITMRSCTSGFAEGSLPDINLEQDVGSC